MITVMTKWDFSVVQAMQQTAQVSAQRKYRSGLLHDLIQFQLRIPLKSVSLICCHQIVDIMITMQQVCYMMKTFSLQPDHLFVQMHVGKASQISLVLTFRHGSKLHEYNQTIHDSTARRWLGKFTQVHIRRFFYGHDRIDVVMYRNDFLRSMAEFDKKSPTCDGTIPELATGEKSYIRVVHDECTYYAISDQSLFWGDETSVPEGVDSVTLDQIRKYFRTCLDYEKAYREGGTGREVEERVKMY